MTLHTVGFEYVQSCALRFVAESAGDSFLLNFLDLHRPHVALPSNEIGQLS